MLYHVSYVRNTGRTLPFAPAALGARRLDARCSDCVELGASCVLGFDYCWGSPGHAAQAVVAARRLRSCDTQAVVMQNREPRGPSAHSLRRP